jgi:hypothetical protein
VVVPVSCDVTQLYFCEKCVTIRPSREILGQAEIAIGDVRQIDVPGELPERGTAFPDGDSFQDFAVLQVRFGVYAELPGLFRLSAGANDRAINLCGRRRGQFDVLGSHHRHQAQRRSTRGAQARADPAVSGARGAR